MKIINLRDGDSIASVMAVPKNEDEEVAAVVAEEGAVVAEEAAAVENTTEAPANE